MRQVKASLALLSMFASLLLTPVVAQNDAATFVAGTNIVLVPVVVTDKKGNHIGGLKSDDFEVKQDDKEQRITSFEEITSEATPAQRPAISPNTFTNQVIVQRPKKLEIIALDLLNTPLAGRVDARRGLVSFLSKSVDENTLVALLVIHGNGVTMIHNFTSDPSVLITAIKKLDAPVSVQDTPTMNISRDTPVDDVTGQPLANLEAAELMAIFEGASDVSSIPGSAGLAAQARGNIAAATARVDASTQSQQGLITLECFQEIARYFAGVPGRKSLIWASTGFNFGLGAMPGELTRGTSPEDWQRTVRLLQDANIAVYPVDVGGLTGTSPGSSLVLDMPSGTNTSEGGVMARSAMLEAVSQGRMIEPTQVKHETMRTVADRTGGEAFYNANNIDDLFRRASMDSAQYYMLSFNTKDISKEGWHKISVKVRTEGAQLRYRTGFFVTKDMKNPESASQADELMAISSDLHFTTLPINGQWQQIETAGSNRKAHFSLWLSPAAVNIDTEHENRINVDFLAVAVNRGGQQVGKVSQRLDRKLPPAGVNQIQNNGLTYVNVLAIPPGQYNVHIIVRDNLTGRLGSVIAPLRVD
jgi:VWFA-related protein